MLTKKIIAGAITGIVFLSGCSSTTLPENSTTKKVTLAIPDQGSLEFQVQKDWNTKVSDFGNYPTLEITSAEENFELLITALPLESDFDLNEVRAHVEEELAYMLPTAAETDSAIETISGDAATGYYFGPLTDKELAGDALAPEGEFKYVVRAVLGIDKLIIGATILSNDDTPEKIEKWLEVLKSVRRLR